MVKKPDCDESTFLCVRKSPNICRVPQLHDAYVLGVLQEPVHPQAPPSCEGNGIQRPEGEVHEGVGGLYLAIVGSR